MLLFRELPVVMDKKVRTGAGSNEAELRECLGKELEVLEGEEVSFGGGEAERRVMYLFRVTATHLPPLSRGTLSVHKP